MLKNLIVFVISILLGGLVFIFVYEFVKRKNIKLSSGRHDNFEHALMNDILYMLISSFTLLVFFQLYNSGFFTYLLNNNLNNIGILESGLFNGLALVVVGIIINFTYLGILKCIRHWVKLVELEENEKTWLTIAGCIMLYVVGKMESDFIFAYSAVSLIIAKFFWVINNSIKKLKENLLEFLHLPIYTIIFIVFIIIVLFTSYCMPQYLFQIIYGLILGIFIGIIVCVLMHKEKN